MNGALPVEAIPWIALLGLGALHGLNPAMGWLFAVALGFQEGGARAVWRALPPLAAGHALAVLLALAVLAVLGNALPHDVVKVVLGVALVGLGAWRLRSHRHPRRAGMRATPGQLTAWSFLMASGHGAGLMVLPLVAGVEAGGAHGAHGMAQASAAPMQAASWLAAGTHTLGYLLVTGLIAWLVCERLGLRHLTRVWFNVDLVWALALVGTGVAVMVGG